MNLGKSGWTVFCSETVCEVMLTMPERADFFVRFFCDFASASGMAVDSGQAPAGKPLDDAGVAYNLLIEEIHMFIEYLVMADIKEFYVTELVHAE
ncbi:hypothetical protein [Actinomadura terrae]|uniref:hypothetical protein n=1 Tax=Actinomadura terrae TaxID=604353 RepID=UPI001FA7902A|nr:hypothetical protein [Actinomadura terrae]